MRRIGIVLALFLVAGVADAAYLTTKTALTSVVDGDLFYIHDVSDVTEDVGGTSKYVTAANLGAYIRGAGGALTGAWDFSGATVTYGLTSTDLPTTGAWDMSSMTVTFGLVAADIPDLSATYQAADADLTDFPTQTGNSGKFLTTNGSALSWGTPAGTGDVTGPASATDSAIVLFDGTGGKTIKDSTYTITAAGAALLDDASAAAQATTLGLGTADDAQFSGVGIGTTAGTNQFAGTGFTVDADGDVTGKSFTASKTSGTAGETTLYEANLTDTDYAGWRGPTSLSAGTSYVGQFPTAGPTAANSILAWDGTGETGTGATSDPYVFPLSWLVVGTNIQAYDADLSTYAGITPSANVQSLLGAASYAAMRTLLDLEAGTDFYSVSAADAAFQPLDADLTTFGGLACTDGQIAKRVTGAWACSADSTGGSPTFDTIAAGTNTTAAMVVGTGASLAVSGSGTINATSLGGTAAASYATDAEVAGAYQTTLTNSAGLAAALTDETGSGVAVFGTSPTLTTPTIASIVNTGTLTLPTSTDTLVGRATTDTLTNKTFDANGTGNVAKGYGYLQLGAPHLFASGVTQQTTATAEQYGQALFGNATDKATNYVEYRFVVPHDLDTSVALYAYFKFQLGGADTGDHEYEISVASVADSGDYTGTLGNAVSLGYTADASGASGDVETASGSLTGWASALTAGNLMVVRVARDGDHANDTSTADSYSGPLVIRYGYTQ